MAMMKILRSLLSGLAAFRRAFEKTTTRIGHENHVALLKAQLLGPIRTHMEIASVRCEIDVELQDPKLREAYTSIELHNSSEGMPPFPCVDVAEMLGGIERACRRDSRFPELLAQARQEFSNELRKTRRRLQDDRRFREMFCRIFNARNSLNGLKALGLLEKPGLPPSHDLILETDQLATLLEIQHLSQTRIE